MDRRSFVAGGAVLTAVGAGAGVLKLKSRPAETAMSGVIAAPEIPLVMTPIAVGSKELTQHVGKRLLLEGWLRPAPHGPGHFFIFTDTQNGPIDRRHVRVYPTDATKVSTGQVQMEGRYFEGRFIDLPTGDQAFAALTEAV